MKKLFSLLLIICLVMSTLSVALAAGAPKITKQPVSATTDKNGKVTFSIKVTNTKGITWRFINPENGEEITAKEISSRFKGLKVINPNSMNLTLKNVPAEMHNWSLYCHLTGNGYHIDSDIVQLKVYGMDDAPTPTAVPETTPEPEPVQEPEASPVPPAEENPFSDAGDTAILEQDSRTITISADNLFLCPIDAKGNPLEDQANSTLSFEGSGDVYVRSDAPVKYWIINGIRIEPAVDVQSFTLTNVKQNLTIAASLNQEASQEAVDTSVQCQVTCEGCVFTYISGGLKSVSSGSVPEGAVIIVVAESTEAAARGYIINGSEAKHKGKSSFRLTVKKDTTITIGQ